ncbi:aminoacyltransferase [Streptococcus iniae]|uniref:aminoacyltransferase n=1 Tax=Streptococcus iniae TaxID=1346 RepID=UPI002B2EDE3E|nr:aminoacyltransferase [Streptococcus iniae]WNZ98115.1 aminoacyltransferase [Streptococcus iniae]
MYTYKVGIKAQEHDAFVIANPACNLLQSSNWGKIKDNWEQELIGFYQGETLVASASILIKKLPLKRSMLYIPRGPIMDYTNYELVDFVVSSLKKYGQSQKAIVIKCDPTLFIKQFLADADPETIEENDITPTIINFLAKRGLEWSGPTKDIAQTIQPRFQANLYKQDFSLENLPKKTKQAIRTAQNKGIEITIGGMELLEDFSQLMKKTEERKGINLRGIHYYRKLMTTYSDKNSYITMARLNLIERHQLLNQQLEKAHQEQAKFTEKTKEGKKKETANAISRIQQELDFLDEKIVAGQTLVPLVATLSLIFGKTSENLYAGMDEEYRHYQVALLTWFETAKQAFDKGCDWQNMGGIENQLDGGLYSFKSKLNPTIEEFAGEFNIPVSLLHKPVMLAYNVRKKLRSK